MVKIDYYTFQIDVLLPGRIFGLAVAIFG
jgi:hypothetical protein